MKTGKTFDLDVIWLAVFLKVVYVQSVSVEKIKLHDFSGMQYRFKPRLQYRFKLHAQRFRLSKKVTRGVKIDTAASFLQFS